MEARITPGHAEAPDPAAWPGQLHYDDAAGQEHHALPRGEAALTRPYVRWPESGGRTDPGPAPAARVLPPGRLPTGILPADGITERAVIGDQIRKAVLWCQMGSCIAWHADPAALGEADNRARAIAAGWREDALRRIACPACLQTSPQFRATHPVVPWNRERAVTMITLMTAVARHRQRYHERGSGRDGPGSGRPVAGPTRGGH